MPDYPIRRSIRLSPTMITPPPGAYLITVCTRNRDCLLGEIRNGRLCISPAGEEVAAI